MWRKLYRDSTSLLAVAQRSIMVQSEIDLLKQMISMNKKKQFKQTLELFDRQKEKHIAKFPDSIITQVLKACTGVKDLQRGSAIHRLILSRCNEDAYLLTSLVHMYSKFHRTH